MPIQKILYGVLDPRYIISATIAPAGKILVSDGTKWIVSTPTYPNASVASGKLIISDGTNFIASTPTFPNTATTGKVLRGNGTNWLESTSTFADTYAVSTILYASSANVIQGLPTAANGVFITDAGGVPSVSSTLPSGLTLPGYVKTDGTTPLTGNWDIGAGRMIQGEQIRARSNLGLGVYEANGLGLTITDTTGYSTFSGVVKANSWDFPEIAPLASPAIDNIRVYAVADATFTVLETVTDLGFVNRINQDSFRVARNESGGACTKGQVVYFSGSTGNKPNFSLARADLESTMPAIGILGTNVALHNFGEVMIVGRLSGIKTDYPTWTEGQALYVSSTVAGGLTNIRPTHPNLSQWIATIEVVHAINGAILVKVQGFLGTEDGTNRNSYTIGDTLTGVKSLNFDGLADSSLQWNSATSAWTFSSGTLSVASMNVVGFVKNTAGGLLSGGNALAVADVPVMTSAEFATKISDKTGTDKVVFNTTPTFATNITAPLIYGSSAANGSITIDGTSHATKTTSYVILQSTDGKVGIGTIAPATRLDVQKDQNTATQIRVRNDTSGTAAQAAFVASYGSFTSYFAGAVFSPAFTPSGLRLPDSAGLFSSGTVNGLRIYTINSANLTLGTLDTANVTIIPGGNVGIMTAAPSARLAINGGVHVGGDSDPGDNNLLVDGTLTVSTPTGYAEMYMYNNVTPCVIDVANAYHAVYNTFGNNDGTLAPQIDTTYFTYKAGVGYVIASVADYNPPTSTQIKITIAAGHALLAGEPVTLTGTTDYDGTYLVLAAGLTATEFVVTKAFTVTRTGSARRGATLRALVAGKYEASFNVSGTPQTPNDNFKWELNKDITPLDNIGTRAVWSSATKYESASARGLCSLTANQYVWLSVKNYSGTGDLTLYSANVNLILLR